MPSEGEGSGPNGRARVSWSGATGGGTTIKDYVVRWDGGSKVVTGTSLDVTGLTNGKSYSFTVQSRNRFEGGESAISGASNSVTPYTRPDQPQISSSNGNCSNRSTCPVSFSITANGGDGGGSGKTLQYRVNGNSWENASGTSHTIRRDLDSAESMSVEARVVIDEGLGSGNVSTSQKAQTYTPPEPKIAGGGPKWQAKGSANGEPGCTSTEWGGNCTSFTIDFENLEPGPSYRVHLDNAGETGWADFTIEANANGRASSPQHWYGYPEGQDPFTVRVDGDRVGGSYNSP